MLGIRVGIYTWQLNSLGLIQLNRFEFDSDLMIQSARNLIAVGNSVLAVLTWPLQFWSFLFQSLDGTALAHSDEPLMTRKIIE